MVILGTILYVAYNNESRWASMKYMITLIILAQILTACSAADTKASESSAPAVHSTPAPTPRPSMSMVKKTEPPFNWTTAEVNEENVRKALSTGIGAAMSVPLTDDTFRGFVSNLYGEGRYVTITINPGMFADEKDFVKRVGGSLIAYSKILFDNPEIYDVTLVANIDNVAGGENKNAVFLTWNRKQAEGIDFDDVLDNMFGDISIPYQLARKYSIQKDIYDNLRDFDLPRDNEQ